MATLAPSFLMGTSSFLQITRTCINAFIWGGEGGGSFAQIRLLSMELTTLERLNNRILMLWPF